MYLLVLNANNLCVLALSSTLVCRQLVEQAQRAASESRKQLDAQSQNSVRCSSRQEIISNCSLLMLALLVPVQ